MSQSSTTTIAGYHSAFNLTHRLLCYQINCKILVHLLLSSNKSNSSVILLVIYLPCVRHQLAGVGGPHTVGPGSGGGGQPRAGEQRAAPRQEPAEGRGGRRHLRAAHVTPGQAGAALGPPRSLRALPAAGRTRGRGRGSAPSVRPRAVRGEGAEHALPPAQGRRRGRPAALAVPLALVLAGPVGAGGRAARSVWELGRAAVAGAPRAAGRAAAARAAAAAAAGRAEDEDGAEEALQGLLLRPAARAALRVLQEQPPAQAAQGVAPAGTRRAQSWSRAPSPPLPCPCHQAAPRPPAAACWGHGWQSAACGNVPS